MKLQLVQVGPTRSAIASRTAAQALRQQSYTTAIPRAPHVYVRAAAGPPPGSNDFRRRMTTVGESLRANRVGAIFLIGSSFAADDARHFLFALARRWPEGRPLIRQLAARIVDSRSHEAGIFSQNFAQLFEQMLGRFGNKVPVRLIHWSGENHHLGRADAAVRLIDEVAALELPLGMRVMLWGQGQAGNVLALLSGLLSADGASLNRFFTAAEIYYRLPATGVIDVPVWHRVRQLLCSGRDRLAQRPLDLVTFGTPLRYAWNQRSTDGLLHFVNHRSAGDTPLHLAPPPHQFNELHTAASGDYLQQLAVSGTDTPPSRFAWRSWLADRRLGSLFDAKSSTWTVAERLACGMRVPDAGTTLLVDYGQPTGPVSEHLAGHAVYTRREWLLFHAEQVVQWLSRHASSCARAA